jgi:PPP family 3-phenylpropionic acid transporter
VRQEFREGELPGEQAGNDTMTNFPDFGQPRHLPLRIVTFYIAIYTFVGVQLPFFPIWLAAKGFDARLIAFVLSATLLVRIVAIPIATRLTDRFGSIRGALIVVSAMSTAGYVVLGFTNGIFGIFSILTVTWLPLAPIMTLLDAYTLKSVRVGGWSYSSFRLWGSLAFLFSTLGAGILLELMAPTSLIWVQVVALVAATAAAVGLHSIHEGPLGLHSSGLLRRRLYVSPQYLAVILAASLVQASHAFFYGFSAIDWSRRGFDQSIIGGLWAIGVAAEITMFAVASRLSTRITPLTLLRLGAAGAVVRWVAMATDPPIFVLPFLQSLHGLSFAATFLGSIQIIAKIAGDRQLTVAQGDLSVTTLIATAGCTALSGVIYESHGTHTYIFMAFIAFIGLCCSLRVRCSSQ